jgi:hypothetical protein
VIRWSAAVICGSPHVVVAKGSCIWPLRGFVREMGRLSWT